MNDRNIFSAIFKLLKQITGKSNWYEAPDSSLSDLERRVNLLEVGEVELKWENIEGKPVSSPSNIDNAVANTHTHNNKQLLDRLANIYDDGTNIGIGTQTPMAKLHISNGVALYDENRVINHINHLVDKKYVDEAITSNTEILSTMFEPAGSAESLINAHEQNYNHNNLHVHLNKTLLDTYTQTNEDLADAVSKRHLQNTDNTLTNTGANTINTTGTGNIVDFKVNNTTKASIDNTGKFTGTVDWSNINSKPSTYTPSTHTHTESDITNLDKYTKSEVDSKLSEKANLIHTHNITDIANLQTTLDGKANITHTHSKTDITDFVHLHSKSDITDFAHVHDDRYYTENEIDSKLSTKSDIGHTHNKADIADFSHTHNDLYYTETEIDGLLANKANIGHTHTKLDVTDFTHTHNISEVNNLQTSLDSKVNVSDVVTTATANKILRLDSSAKLPADITGNAATATKLQTARTISLTGDATGSASFDGSGNVTITTTLANSGVTAGTYPKVTVDAKGRVTSGSSLSASDIPSLDMSKVTSGNLDTTRLSEPSYVTGSITRTARPLFDVLRADRTAFLPASQIIIEKSTDAGVTWEDAGISDTVKQQLFTGQRPSIAIPLKNGVKNTDCMIRITITGMRYNVPSGTAEIDKYNYWNSGYILSTERYFAAEEAWVWLSSNSDRIYCKVERATGANPNNWILDREAFMKGWSGGNYISLSGNTFGGGTSQTSNYWNWRFTFRTATNSNDFDNAKLSTNYTTAAQVIHHIKIGGRNVWTFPNKLMYHDHIYSWDENQNVTFPANVTANTFNGALNGNASTASKLQIARTISLTGDVTGSSSFDGSANASITVTLTNSGVTAGTYTKVTVDSKGRITSGTTLSASDIPNLDWSKITTGKPTTLAGYGITDAVSSSEVVTTATPNKILKLDSNGKLPTSITGDADTVDGKHASAFALSSHTHTKSQITDFTHTHIISEIGNLQTTLDSKAPVVHTHNLSDINDIPSNLEARLLAIETVLVDLLGMNENNAFMYNLLANLWVKGKITSATVQRAVSNEFITQQQANEILAMQQNP